MIEVVKIAHDILYNSDVSLKFAYYLVSITRCNKYKLLNHSFHHDLRNLYFFLHGEISVYEICET